MGIETAIAIAAGAALVQGGLSIYGAIKEDEHREGQYNREKDLRKVQYDEARTNIKNAKNNLTTDFKQAVGTMEMERGQTQDIAYAQAKDSAIKSQEAIENANNQIADYRKEASRQEGTALSQAASSGVRRSGTVKEVLDQNEEENQEKIERAEDKVDNSIGSFQRATGLHFQQLDDYEERYSKKLADMGQNYETRMRQLDTSKDLLTKKYKAGEALTSHDYNYQNEMSWMKYVNAGLDTVQTGFSLYGGLNDIDASWLHKDIKDIFS